MELLFFVLYSALLLLLLRACTLNETNYRPKKYGKTVENIEVKVGMEKTQKQTHKLTHTHTHIHIHIHICLQMHLYTEKMKITKVSTNMSNLLQCCYPFSEAELCG